LAASSPRPRSAPKTWRVSSASSASPPKSSVAAKPTCSASGSP
jgi:hypothetical protein